MQPINNTVQAFVWGFLGAIILGILTAWILRREQTAPALPVLGTLPSLHLTNQLGQVVTDDALPGRIGIFNIIFTRCGGPCPRITAQMKELQDALPGNAPVRFISLTSDPEFDDPAVLTAYANRYGADAARWWFLTGAKSELYDFAIRGLRFTVIDNQEAAARSAEDLFIHSLKFVLVDGAGRIRAYVDGGETDTVAEIKSRVQILLNEESAP